jgi:predicted metal-dependent HD superfamily phosphohydrolase
VRRHFCAISIARFVVSSLRAVLCCVSDSVLTAFVPMHVLCVCVLAVSYPAAWSAVALAARRAYANDSDEVVRGARAELLTEQLSSVRLFHTAELHAAYEQPVRQIIRAEADQLIRPTAIAL